jgi:dTDP-glucose 4,6-dehydratase
MAMSEPFMPRRVLVTGGAGFIGSALVDALLAGHAGGVLSGFGSGAPASAPALERLVVLDALTYAGRRENLDGAAADPRFTFVHGDVCDRPLVDRLFAEHAFDAVAHLAAESHVDRSIADGAPFVRTNIVGTFTLLDAARAAWAADSPAPRRFLYVSSDEVYGSLGPDGAFDESSRYAPSSPYAASKASGDMLSRAYFVTHGVPVVVTHSSNNYGPRQTPEKLIPLCTARARAGDPLPLYGDGRHVRQWLHVDDHARALALALARGRPGETYDFGGPSELANRDTVALIADAVDTALGRPAGTSRRLVTPVADRPGHDFRYAIDSSKARAALRWEPRIPFDQGLDPAVRWYLAHPGWLRC